MLFRSGAMGAAGRGQAACTPAEISIIFWSGGATLEAERLRTRQRSFDAAVGHIGGALS